MTTREHLCELGCGKPAPTTTICYDCADHPRHAVNEFTQDELDRLYAIARGEERPSGGVARKNSDDSEIPDVLNAHAFVLAQDITKNYPELIETLPHLPRHKAVRLYWKILSDCEQAQAMINGQHIEWREEHYTEAYKELADPKTYEELIEWFWDRLRIHLSYDRLRKWKQRGRIKDVETRTGESPRFKPRDVLDVLNG